MINIRFEFSKIKKTESQIGICHQITSRGSSITGNDKQQIHSPLLPLMSGNNIIFNHIDKANTGTQNVYLSYISSLSCSPEHPELGLCPPDGF